MFNAHLVTKAFELEIATYTGAPFCVAVNSCTMALLLALKWCGEETVQIPKRTYVGVPMSAKHAGCCVEFVDTEWLGAYQIAPSPVWDSARWLTRDLYRTLDNRTKCTAEHAIVCLSFHATKTLGIEQGGAILHSDPAADAWFRRMRFDGRTEGVAPKDDTFSDIGYHCYMNPSTAAQGLMRMAALRPHNEPLPNDPYPDLSQFEALNG